MQSFMKILFAALGLASLASAGGTVIFNNQDSTTRTIVFTAQEGLEILPNLVVPGSGTASQSFPDSWIGNFYSVSEGAEFTVGMLGEVRFDGFAGSTYFDVSAIVNDSDNEGIKMLMPSSSPAPASGCQTFPCSNQYNKWDDVETRTLSLLVTVSRILLTGLQSPLKTRHLSA